MKPDRLLAKSGPSCPGTLLQGHTWQVMESARLLLDSRLTAAERSTRRSLASLRRLVPLAAFLHDLGKGNDVFQQMLRQRAPLAQPVRHEALSLLLARQILRDWLLEAYSSEEIDRASVIAAGHHRKFPCRAVAESSSGAASCTLLLQHPDFEKTLRLGTAHLGLPAVPPSLLRDRQVTRARAETLIDEASAELSTPPRDVELAVAKAFLLAADVLGSAEPEAKEREAFARGALTCRASAEALDQIARARLGNHAPRPFQEQIARSDAPVTLATAGCGTGKTVAAYLWARQHAGRQIWFCYPTTGTATEGFRDYLLDVDLETRLEHSRRAVDMEIFGLVDGDDEEGSAQRHFDRLEALRVWGSEVVSCTVDTVLGLLHCQRKGMYAWPGLADAAFVFDEVHAYDRRLFGSLLRLLAALPGAPVLMMTATLPEPRLAHLRRAVQEAHGRPLTEIRGPSDLEERPRYSGARASLDEAVDRVRSCLASGGKVLWVCNTVGRCQQIADRAWSVPPLRYHSRYRYLDRIERHREVIDAFARTGPCLAVTTQVCEMSLDLSADLLVTELAPIPALVQRLGRLNRRAAEGDPPRPFVVVEPRGALPYSEDDLREARNWLEQLCLPAEGLSQRDLAAAWLVVGGGRDDRPDQSSIWLDGGPVTEPQEARQANPSLTVVRHRDAAQVQQDPEAAVRLSIPMNPPRGRDWLRWPRVRHLVVPPEGALSYDPLRGAEWL